MTPFIERLRDMCAKPGMYFGGPYTRALFHWLMGYTDGLAAAGVGGEELDGWREWVQMRFEVFHSAWSWVRILQHAHGSDAAALQAVPDLYEQFLRDREAWGIEGIEQRMKEAVRKRYGEDWGEPARTRTRPDWDMNSSAPEPQRPGD